MYSGGIEHPYKDGIIFVSNRGPFKIVDDKYVLTKGGLVSATLGLMKDGKSSWITASEEVGKNPVYHHNGDGYNFTWKTVHTSEEIIESYYENICNSFLWPVCHYSEDILRSRTFPKITGSFNISDYDDYFQTNRNFAQAVKREYEFSPRPIWIQDYHFLPAPRLVRRGLKPIVNGSVRDVPIGFFMHPPFISKYARDLLNSNELWKHYDNESPRKDIALGMLGADLIGFHVPEYVNDCVDFITEAVPGIKVDRDSKYVIITHEKDGKRNETYIGAFPIGLEIEKILESSKLENGCDHNSEYLDMDNLIKRRKSQGVTVICGLGRMDYTKGILESLEIMEEMLTRGENVQYIGYWCPSRENVPGYDMLRKTVLEKAESINDRFRHDDILPVIIKNEEIKYPDNMLLFRDANIVMVPSLKDGFHLVPVEAILANSHLPYTERALVVMSPNCGASYVLQDFNETDGLVRVNPLDTTGSTNEILHVYNNAYHISDSLIDFAKRMDVRAWQAANMNALYEIKQHKRTLALR